MVAIKSRLVQTTLESIKPKEPKLPFDTELALKSSNFCGYPARRNVGFGGSKEYQMPDTLDAIREGYLIFDVGCGNASQLFTYSWLVGKGKICCIEPSKELAEKARQNLESYAISNAQVYEQDGSELEPLVKEHEKPDLIFLFNVIPYVTSKHASAIVKACFEAGKEGTRIICSTASKEAHLMDAELRNDRKKYEETLEGRIIYHYEDNGVWHDAEGALYSQNELRGLFVSAGFEIERIVSLGDLKGIPTEYYLIATKTE